MFRLEMVILHEDRRELENNELRMSHLRALLSFRPNNVLLEGWQTHGQESLEMARPLISALESLNPQ